MNYKELIRVVDSKKDITVAEFASILEDYGFAFYNWYEVTSKDGRVGTRYELSAEKGADAEGLKTTLKKAFGDRALFSEGAHRYAPELKRQSVVILNS